jgi:hypothetical protein
MRCRIIIRVLRRDSFAESLVGTARRAVRRSTSTRRGGTPRPTHRMNCIAALAVLFAVLMATSVHAADVRDVDLIHLGESQQPTLRLKVLHRTTVSASRDGVGVLGNLAEGQAVEVIELGEKQCYVSARVATGAVQGWVDAQALEAAPEELLAQLHTRNEDAEAHRRLISRHEVAVGMTRAEVRASLGKPDRTYRLRTRQGDQEMWSYVIYQYVPHYSSKVDDSGVLRRLVSYRREPFGRKSITFQGDQVADISDGQGNKPDAPSVIVPPPDGASN